MRNTDALTDTIDMLRQCDPVTIYDVFYDKGSHYAGVLFAAEQQARDDGDDASADAYKSKQHELNEMRRSVKPDDVDTMISYISEWNTLANKLASELR